MGGGLEVDSVLGRGSTFTATVRLRRAAGSVPADRAERALAGRRVLVVDDSESNRRVLSRQLESWGMTCTDVAAPLDALGLVAGGERYDAALLDMHMPGMDGIHLAAALRRVPTGSALPLVLLTSDQARGDRTRQGAFAAVLTKPVRATALRSALLLALSGGSEALRPAPARRTGGGPGTAAEHPPGRGQRDQPEGRRAGAGEARSHGHDRRRR